MHVARRQYQVTCAADMLPRLQSTFYKSTIHRLFVLPTALCLGMGTLSAHTGKPHIVIPGKNTV